MGVFNEDYWRKSRLKEALGINMQDVHKLFCNKNDIICKRMKNSIRATRKNNHNYRSNLTKDSFLFTMFESEDELIDNWNVELKIPGELEKGWNFKIQYTQLYYAN